ncbi:MAG: pyridoxine 5'-phosphate synthase [Candidatus Hydrogenedentes bacterium]|nr:pyridoxine 5'-phosphate synthase [Candidatus Hydrogenedentota bacterium]
MIELGVNIDHVATLREARKGHEPDVVTAAKICELAGAHQITIHLRQDRRHIQDRDVAQLRDVLQVRMNLEMAAVDEIVAIALKTRPHTVCLVPENRREVTTEGGLDVASQVKRLREVTKQFHDAGIKVSLFIDPDLAQVDASAQTGADFVELHTGAYANAGERDIVGEIDRIAASAARAIVNGLIFNAGHGLTVRNLRPIASIPGLNEVNIGHSIISRAVFIGLDAAVQEILAVLNECSR